MSIAVLHSDLLTKIETQGAFLQSGPAERDLYVKPPRKYTDEEFYCLCLLAIYGLKNAKAKWK